MCEWNKYGKTRIDPCIRHIIKFLYMQLKKGSPIPVSCCCGHGKYPMTIVMKEPSGEVFELFSQRKINRQKRFYKRDRQGYYYIPEVSKEK